MLHRMVAARLKNIIETDEVGFNIDIRVGDAVPDAGLCGKVDDDFRFVFRKELFHQRFIRNVSFYECPAAFRMLQRRFLDFGQAVFLDGNIVIVVQVVKPDKLYALDGMQQRSHEICPDKTGGTRHENGFVFQFNIRRQHFVIPLYSFLTAS